MGTTITNANGGDVAFYVGGECVALANGASITVDDANASALMDHPVFAAMVESGQLNIAGAEDAPAPAGDAPAAEVAEAPVDDAPAPKESKAKP